MNPEFPHLEGDEPSVMTTLEEAIGDPRQLLDYAWAWASRVPPRSVWWISDKLFDILHAAIYIYGDSAVIENQGHGHIQKIYVKSITLRRRSQRTARP